MSIWKIFLCFASVLLSTDGFAQFYIPHYQYRTPVIRERMIDKTSVTFVNFVKPARHTKNGERLDFDDGTYFIGNVVDGKMGSGTFYSTKGNIISSFFDEKGLMNGNTYMETEDGTWIVGKFSHAVREGVFYIAKKSGDGYTYRRDIWRDNKRESGEMVDEPDWNDAMLSFWFSDIHPPKASGGDYVPPVYVAPVYNNSNFSSASESAAPKPQKYRQCPVCKGNGYWLDERDFHGREAKHYKGSCSVCGKLLWVGLDHKHPTCKCCNGSGQIPTY